MSTINLQVDNLTAGAPLWKQFAGQHSPQPAHVQMTEGGEVSANYSGEVGNGVPMIVHHGRTRRWRVQPAVSGLALRKFLEVDGKALLERIHAGHSVDWDGNNNVGKLDDDAEQASERFDDLLGDLACCNIWTAKEFLFSSCKLAEEVWGEGMTLDAAVAACQADIDNYDEGIVSGDVKEALLDQAEAYFFGRRADSLLQAHVDALVADGRVTAEEAAEWALEHAE